MMLPLAIDLSVPQTTPGQQLVAYIVVALFAIGVAYLTIRSHYSGLPTSLSKAKASYRGARADTALSSVYLTADQARDEWAVRNAVADVLDDAVNPDATMRGAAGTVRDELYRTWAPYILRVPKPARRLASLAALVTVLGLVAVSTDVLIRLISTSTPGVRPERWGSLAASQSVAVLEQFGALLSTTPGLNLLWTLVLVLIISGGAWLYAHWYVSVVLLVIAAVEVVALDDLAAWTAVDVGEDTWLPSLPDPWQVLRVTSLGVTVTWLLVLVAIGAGREIGGPSRGVTYGVAALAGVGLVAVALVGYGVYIRRTAIQAFPERVRAASRLEIAAMLVRTQSVLVAAAVGPLIPIYAGVAILRAPRLWGALVAADAPIQAIVVLVVVAVTIVLGWQAREAWGDVRAALQITAAKQSVRTAVAAKGIPVAVVAVTYTLVAGLSKSILIGLVVAVAAGLLAREVVTLLARARYKARGLGGSESTAQRVVIEGAELDPPDAPVAGYVRVNGERELLWPARDELADAVVTVAQALVDGDEDVRTVPEKHAEFAFDSGIADPDETQTKLYERARRIVFHELRDNGHQVPRSHLEDELADLPTPLDRVDREAGIVAAEWERGHIRLDDEYVTLRRDPYV